METAEGGLKVMNWQRKSSLNLATKSTQPGFRYVMPFKYQNLSIFLSGSV